MGHLAHQSDLLKPASVAVQVLCRYTPERLEERLELLVPIVQRLDVTAPAHPPARRHIHPLVLDPQPARTAWIRRPTIAQQDRVAEQQRLQRGLQTRLAHSRQQLARGRAHPRRVLYMAALSAIRWEPACRACYQRLSATGKQHKRAMVAVMRKLACLLTALLRDDRCWQAQPPVRALEAVA